VHKIHLKQLRKNSIYKTASCSGLQGRGYTEEGMIERVLGYLHHLNLVLMDKTQGGFRLEGTWMKLLPVGDLSACAGHKYMF
jgi:hypothetical protein